ncbi:MAG: alkaline phosphatase D family protein, partial [Deltaproteobacteria bacterium]|nr:alkaline phosphatase D family protein [Deltaproteobacteria bacterium]
PTHGISVGDVTATSAVVWMRGGSAGWLNVVARSAAGTSTGVARAARERDFIGKVELRDLSPGTWYDVVAWMTRSPDRELPPARATRLSFSTAPSAGEPARVSFAWGGDVGGQNVCRDSRRGYPAFRTLSRLSLSFFVGLGDMIYADGTCLAHGGYGNPQVPGEFPRSTRLSHFRAHWAYNREDPHSRALLARTPYLAVWDDHEIANDAGPFHDRSTADLSIPLMRMALRSFLEWNPVAEPAATPGRLYRSIRWGRHLELIVLDTRQYRDPNYAPDTAERPKTMLGREQRMWLEERLRSDATWKVVVSSVPMSIPTGQDSFGRDGWANEEGPTGFERELVAILRYAHAIGIRNMLWISTDAHFGAGFRYRPFAEDPAFVVHEIITGPLNAALFPSDRLDSTLRPERLFHHGPEDAGAVRDLDTALSWMTYGLVQIDERGRLTVSVHRVATGEQVFAQTLTPRD